MGKQKKKTRSDKTAKVTLKTVAEHVGLAPGTVSSVLNNADSAKSIPLLTRLRVQTAVKELNYRPNFFARSLRKRRSYTIGLILEEIGDVYGSMVIAGVESHLRKNGYFFLTVIHRHDPEMLRDHSRLLVERGAEGLITVDATLEAPPPLPTVSVAGHRDLPGVTNVVLDQEKGVRVAMQHLVQLGHTKIAFIKGQPFSSDSELRWSAVCKVAQELGLTLDKDLIAHLEVDDPSPQVGYPVVKALLARKKPFTALLAYNDISAIGAMRAIQEAGLRVPHDVSVVGFDDIQWASFVSPSLTTVRQPLAEMGTIAAETIIRIIEKQGEQPQNIAVEPSLVVRNSTGPAIRT